MKPKVLLILIAVLVLAGLLLWRRTAPEREQSQPEPTESTAPQAITPPVSTGNGSNSDSPRPAEPVTPAAINVERAWAEFKKRFGQDLRAKFTKEGYLASLEGSVASGVRAGSGFKSDDPRKAVARAQEILAAAGPLIGIQPEFPLESPFARTGQTSAQVFFREAVGGVPIAPYGSVSVDLGPNGELIGLNSDYVRNISVENQRKLDVATARGRAASAVKDPGTALRVEGGDGTIWIVSPSQPGAGQSVIAKHAFEFNVKGWQVVVDAEDGRVIFKRDVRIR